MNFKKLIATAAFALGAWMNSEVASADTYYVFDYSGTANINDAFPAWGAPGSVSFTLNTDASGNVIGASGFSISNAPTGTVFGAALAGSAPYDSTTTDFFVWGHVISSPTLPTDISFAVNYGGYLTGYSDFIYSTKGGVGQSDWGMSGSSPITLVSVSSSVAAPEIDGSLAPKVGFLLGCLFLMFGRKKQNTEPMMIA